MTESKEAFADRLRELFADALTRIDVHAGQITLELPAARLLDVCERLREDPQLSFRQLVDLCGVDYLSYGKADWQTSQGASGAGFSRGVENGRFEDAHWRGPRFAVVYHLLSHARNLRLRLRTYAEGDPPRVASVNALFASAVWYEREAFDLFGILFEGHPDLRRILSDYGFKGHPFRKDFPLIGEVEMRYDPEKRRVVYQPVSIEPRTLVPKVIQHDHRYAERGQAGADGVADDA